MDLGMLESNIRAYFAATWDKTPVYQTNYEPGQDSEWVRLTFLYSDAVFGDQQTDYENGFLYIDIFVPLKTGTKTSREYAEEIRKLFRNKTIDGIPFTQVSIKPKGESGGYYHTQVIANFSNFIE